MDINLAPTRSLGLTRVPRGVGEEGDRAGGCELHERVDGRGVRAGRLVRGSSQREGRVVLYRTMDVGKQMKW